MESSPPNFSRPMRVLFVIARGDSFGGSSLHILDMASRLEQEGHTVEILVGGTPDMEVPERFTAAGLTFRCLLEMGRTIHPLRDFRAVLRIRREIRDFGPDIVSLHSSKAGALGRLAALGTGIPVLYTPHCWSFVEGFRHASVYRILERILAPLATRIVTVSDDERSFGLRMGVGREDQVQTIHNGVRDPLPEGFPGRTRGTDPIRLIMVARFEEQKNQELLIEALSRLTRLPWTLTLVGEGPFRSRCIERVESLGLSDRITFAGYSSDIPGLLCQHDLFLLISRWEGFPRSTLEAMACGLPVISSDVGGSREAVRSGETGFLVEPDDLRALTQTLEAALTRPHALQKMGAKGRERFLEHFSFETMFSKYLKLYSELVPEGMTVAPPSRPLNTPANPSPGRSRVRIPDHA